MSEQTKFYDSALNFWSGCNGAPRRKSKSAVKDALRLNRNWGAPTGWRRRIFSLSLGDWLDPEVPAEWLAEMLDTIRQCDQVNWILCTKRPELWEGRLRAAHYLDCIPDAATHWITDWLDRHPPQNVCLLASVENQDMASQRIPALLRIPARWRGLSMEPLLGPVDLHGSIQVAGPTGHHCSRHWLGKWAIDWLIIGGESGPNARPCNVDWIRSLVAQGKAAGVATFVKQLGSNPKLTEADMEVCWLPDENGNEGFKHQKGGDPSEWPDDLRVQEWPEGL